MSYQCPYPPQTGLTKFSHIRTLTNRGITSIPHFVVRLKYYKRFFKEEGGLKTLLVLMALLLLLLSR